MLLLWSMLMQAQACTNFSLQRQRAEVLFPACLPEYMAVFRP